MSKVHRFHDKCAVYLGTGETAYMTVKEARSLSKALNKIARSIERESFQDSTGNAFEINLENDHD